MRKMRRTKKLNRTKIQSRNRIFIFTSGGLVTALFLVLVLVSLENPSGGTGSVNREPSSSLTPPSGSDKGKPEAVSSGEAPLTFYKTLTRDDPEKGSPAGFGKENFAPPASPPDTKDAEFFGVKGYTIQVAALANKATAETLAKRLRRKGFASQILPLSVPNRGTLYRVRIGGFRSQTEAEKWVTHLKQEEGLSPFIARDKG